MWMSKGWGIKEIREQEGDRERGGEGIYEYKMEREMGNGKGRRKVGETEKGMGIIKGNLKGKRRRKNENGNGSGKKGKENGNWRANEKEWE